MLCLRCGARCRLVACAGGAEEDTQPGASRRAVASPGAHPMGLSREGVGARACGSRAEKQAGTACSRSRIHGVQDGPSSGFLGTPVTSAVGGRRPDPGWLLHACK